MKILFIISSLGQGGAENVLVQLANHWTHTHNVHVLTLRGKEKDFFTLDDLVKRHSLNQERRKWYRPGPYLRILCGIRKTIRTVNPDFVVSFVIKTNIFSLIACPHKTPLIVCEHSILRRDDIDWKQKLLRRLFYPKAAKIGVLTNSIKEDFHKLYPSIFFDKVKVIPNPISINDIEIPYDFTDVIDNIKGREKIIVSLGRFVPLKSYDKLIRSFSLLSEKRDDCRLVIYGEGILRDSLENLIVSLHLEGKAFLPGYTNQPQNVLASADLYAVTSDFEGFPMSIAEALALGTPCAGFDVPGVRDLVENGMSGILVQKDDLEALAVAMDNLLYDEKKRESYIRAGKNVIVKYSFQTIDEIWFSEVLV